MEDGIAAADIMIMNQMREENEQEKAMREMVQEYNKEMEKMEQLLWKAHTKLMNEFGEENCELITEIREYLIQEE